MTDATQKCPVCGAKLPISAKFCGECGTSIRPASGPPNALRTTHQSPVLPWFIAGCVALAVHAAVIIVAVRGGVAPTVAPVPTESAPLGPTGSTGRAPDISNLSPREAADRLYERVARAQESGDSAQVSFFGPMALNAYSRVSPLDADARMHIGMVQIAIGDAASASAQADSITRFSATHLFGPVLKARAALATGDRAGAREAFRAFLANYDAELRKNLQEYQQHGALLTETRTEAQGGGSR